jgi:hypothetical protein
MVCFEINDLKGRIFMKKIAFALAMVSLAACGTVKNNNASTKADSAVAAVDMTGKVYSRMVATGGLFGQPAGTRKHTIKFLEGSKLIDNSDTFFGNPPATRSYHLNDHVIAIRISDTSSERYILSADLKTLTGEAGAVLTIEGSADDLTTANLQQSDITAVIGLFNRVSVPAVSENADCSSDEAVIESRVTGFNPAQWTIAFGSSKVNLTQAEIQSMIVMFNRLNVAGVVTGITHVEQVLIKSRACNLSPASWTVTYQKAQ